MLEALCDRPLEKPGLYVDEMASFLRYNFLRYNFLRYEFRVQVTNSSLKRALASAGWSNKVARQRAKEQNADLRDFYLHNLSDFQSHHLVYVDESGCDKRIGFRRTGWSPLGVTPLQVANFHRDQRYRYCLHIASTESCFLVYSKVPWMLCYSRTSLISYLGIAEDGQSRSPF
jgi:hypothetical protein